VRTTRGTIRSSCRSTKKALSAGVPTERSQSARYQTYTVSRARNYWMDAPSAISQKSRVATEPKNLKLSDEFGQYTLVLTCGACGHERHAQPNTLARLCGWDARIDEVTRRLRCSKCGKKQCAWRAYSPSKPRGHSSLPR
jgi:hypothetical protein